MSILKKLRKDDVVKVITGKDVGKTGKIIEVDKKKQRVIVEGINVVKKTVRKSQKNPNGGIIEVEASLNASNVMLTCPKCKKATRIGYVVKDDKKSRVCKKCNSEIDS